MNRKRHGISSEQACNVFGDPYYVAYEDCETEEGVRYHAIGYVNGQLLAVVVYLDQTEGDELHYHFISARKAEAPEESFYADQFA